MSPSLSEVAGELTGTRKLILLHDIADCDAIGSAIAVARAFPPADICGAGGISRLGRRLLDMAGASVIDVPEYHKYDTFVVLDTSNIAGLGLPPEVPGPKKMIIIDHHLRNLSVGGAFYYSDETKPSCAEIVSELLTVAGKKTDKDTARALAAGILTDTAHFRFAKTGTLRHLVGILERAGLELEEVLALVEEEETDLSKKVAYLKGAQRLRFDQFGGHVVAVSNVSAFEGGLCKALLGLGADVAFAGAQDRKEFRISGRATQALVRKGFHIGKMMEETGGEMGGQGGGHAGAAGMSGTGEMEAALNILSQKAAAALRGLR